MELRVEELSIRTTVPVDTIRYYQQKGLLPPPRRAGRVAWYGPHHVERLERVRELRARGFTLATIARLVAGELDAADEALVGELTAGPGAVPPAPGSTGDAGDPPETFTLEELAGRSGVPLPLLKAVEAEGLLVPRRIGTEDRYTAEDLDAVAAGMTLLDWGLPLGDLLELSRLHHRHTAEVAGRAVELFSDHIRSPRRAPTPDGDGTDGDGADRLVAAYAALLPAVTTLVRHHFTRELLRAALAHIEDVGSPVELRAVRDSSGELPS